MYWFDLRQQFGVPGIVLAAVGVCLRDGRWPRRGLLLVLVYAANLGFAWTYNVGDAYIFFLPAHYVVALCGGAGVARICRGAREQSCNRAGTAVRQRVPAYPVWRGYDTFPAVDRSWDNRAERCWIGSRPRTPFMALI